MKLIGSGLEQEMRRSLIRSNLELQNGSHEKLASALQAANIEPSWAYVIDWIPEQAEDIYTVLVSRNELVKVEIPRGIGGVLFEKIKISTYERTCSKMQKLRFFVAQELLSNADNLPTSP